MQYKYIFQAFLVTLLWSLTVIVVKYYLSTISPLYFAALRFLIATIILTMLIISNKTERAELRTLPFYWWQRFILYGIFFVTANQAFYYIGLVNLSSITASFILNFTPVGVLLLALIIKLEKYDKRQISLIGISILGIFIYFSQFSFNVASITGIIFMILALCSNVIATTLGRAYNQSKYSSLLTTTIALSAGTILLTILAFFLEDFPQLTYFDWLMIIGLGIITVVAYIMWNNAFAHVNAANMSVINNSMTVQIAILAILFLGELPNIIEWIGLIIVVIATVLLQLVQD